MNDWRDDGAAAHQQQLEQQEQEVTGFWCPYCGTVYPKDRSECDTVSTIVCCGEMHCEPYTLELETLQ